MCINKRKQCLDCMGIFFTVFPCRANGLRKVCCENALETASIKSFVCQDCRPLREQKNGSEKRRYGPCTIDWEWKVEECEDWERARG